MVTSCRSWITSDIISDSNLYFQCVKMGLDLVTKMEGKYYSVLRCRSVLGLYGLYGCRSVLGARSR